MLSQNNLDIFIVAKGQGIRLAIRHYSLLYDFQLYLHK